jgi:hypothetical protein
MATYKTHSSNVHSSESFSLVESNGTGQMNYLRLRWLTQIHGSMNYKGFPLMKTKLKKDFCIYPHCGFGSFISCSLKSLNSSHNPVKITTGCPLINSHCKELHLQSEK